MNNESESLVPENMPKPEYKELAQDIVAIFHNECSENQKLINSDTEIILLHSPDGMNLCLTEGDSTLLNLFYPEGNLSRYGDNATHRTFKQVKDKITGEVNEGEFRLVSSDETATIDKADFYCMRGSTEEHGESLGLSHRAGIKNATAEIAFDKDIHSIRQIERTQAS